MANMRMDKNPMPEQAPEVRNHNFKEVALGYTAEQAMDEAERCLHCKNKPCVSGCPVGVDIPGFIAEVAKGDFAAAYEVISDTNALPGISGRVCPQESQCEMRCVRGIKGEPVAIGRLERFVADWYREHVNEMPKKPESNGVKVAVVGSGPAGLTCASDLAKLGYQVTIFEGKDKIGGVLRYGIPEFRLPKSILDDFEYRHLRLKDIKVRPNTTIGGAIGIDDLFRDGYKAIFIGTGVWQPNTLHIKGETLGHVHFGINYLNNPDSYHLGQRVIVIGAGNAAMDVARTALRKGVRHLQCFSRDEGVAASKHEFQYAVLEGVEFVYSKAPVEILDEGVVFADLVTAEDGSRQIVPGSEQLYPADSVIISISQGPRNRIVSTTKGIATTSRGLIEADGTGHTTRPGVFASGDVVNGARTVVEAVAHSKEVAEAMDQYMQSLPKE